MGSGERPRGCRDPPALGQAVSTAAPCLFFTHWTWFPQFELDLRSGLWAKTICNECIRWNFTTSSALGLILCAPPWGSTLAPQTLQGGFSITAWPDPV